MEGEKRMMDEAAALLAVLPPPSLPSSVNQKIPGQADPRERVPPRCRQEQGVRTAGPASSLQRERLFHLPRCFSSLCAMSQWSSSFQSDT